MLKIFFSSLLLLLFTACTPPSTILVSSTNTPKEIDSSTILKLPIPVREHGYSNFKTKIFTSQNQLENFILQVKNEKSWNQKNNFLDTLTLAPLDFTKYNLIIYRITESSGSTVLAIDAPRGDGQHILITIGRDKPQMGTADMAYYAIAYKVAKSVKDITFDNGIKKDVIKNKITKNYSIPQGCLAWFDGCNNCGRVGNSIACTEKACLHYDPFKCTKWK